MIFMLSRQLKDHIRPVLLSKAEKMSENALSLREETKIEMKSIFTKQQRDFMSLSCVEVLNSKETSH